MKYCIRRCILYSKIEVWGKPYYILEIIKKLTNPLYKKPSEDLCAAFKDALEEVGLILYEESGMPYMRLLPNIIKETLFKDVKELKKINVRQEIAAIKYMQIKFQKFTDGKNVPSYDIPVYGFLFEILPLTECSASASAEALCLV